MNRSDKLKTLEDKKTAKEMVIITNGEPFLKALEGKIKSLKDTLDTGTELKNVDELLVELENISSLKSYVEELNQSISNLNIPEFPDSIKLEGLNSLTEVIKTSIVKEVKMNKKDLEQLEIIPKKLDQLIKKIDILKVPTPKQRPDNYIPMRRVMLVGKTLMYDDSFYTGGGGGGGGMAVPTILYQPISQSGAGTTALVGAVAGKRIKVTNYVVVMGGAGTVKFQSGSSDITGAMSFAANGGVATGGTEFSTVFQTGVNEVLSLITTGASGNGHMSYYLE